MISKLPSILKIISSLSLDAFYDYYSCIVSSIYGIPTKIYGVAYQRITTHVSCRSNLWSKVDLTRDLLTEVACLYNVTYD